jgi:hypothetical protein
MASSITACAQTLERPDFAHHKLDRLRELRAVIDTLRRDSEPQDPLLTWIVERDSTEDH